MADKVYYDESCYVCSLEINAVRSRGEHAVSSLLTLVLMTLTAT